jgi:hypothetical protein
MVIADGRVDKFILDSIDKVLVIMIFRLRLD